MNVLKPAYQRRSRRDAQFWLHVSTRVGTVPDGRLGHHCSRSGSSAWVLSYVDIMTQWYFAGLRYEGYISGLPEQVGAWKRRPCNFVSVQSGPSPFNKSQFSLHGRTTRNQQELVTGGTDKSRFIIFTLGPLQIMTTTWNRGICNHRKR